jgi:putative phosphoesterase
MTHISLLSDSHSHIDSKIIKHLQGSDEIWHAGDIGDPMIIKDLESITKLRAVYGNIDSHDIRGQFPLNLRFEIEGLKIFMTHIAGYPKKYNHRVRSLFKENPCDLFICGHSHILKVARDKEFGHLHMNPGAIGLQGFHQVRTLLQFKIKEGKVFDLEVAEWPRWPPKD